MTTTTAHATDTAVAETGVLRRVLRRIAFEVRRAMAQVGEPHKDGALPM